MLNVGKIEEGFVLDHIQAGMAMSIYHHLQLDKLDCTVAIIKNARSDKMGKKDILKVECDVNMLDLDVLGFIDHNITVNVIKSGAKIPAVLPRSSRSCRRSSSSLTRTRKFIAANTVKKNLTNKIFNA